MVIFGLLILSGCGTGNAAQYKPIQGFTGIMDIFVWPMAALIYGIGKTAAFGNYGFAIIIATVIVRTLAWPIYAKTNDMSLKMQLMAPEQAKLEAKYAGKDDPTSQQRKQMEMMQLYKKYGVGFGGCLMPLVQFPIFIAFYETLQRIPKTMGTEYSLNFGFFSGNLFGIDLFKGRIENGAVISTVQSWGIIILAALVGLTQIASQIIATNRQKKQKLQNVSDIPEYRRPQPTDAQKSTEMSMKIFMNVMTAMMVFMVYSSTAALGLYWLVGNIYSALQAYVSYRLSESRMEKLKTKIK
jgi:YidC/Oxa1 family membrane protein insertase